METPPPVANELPMEESDVVERPYSPPNAWFRWAAGLSALFVVTVFILIALTLGDSRSPVNQWLDRWIGWILAIEFLAVVFTGSWAMLTDSPATPVSSSSLMNFSETEASLSQQVALNERSDD